MLSQKKNKTNFIRTQIFENSQVLPKNKIISIFQSLELCKKIIIIMIHNNIKQENKKFIN